MKMHIYHNKVVIRLKKKFRKKRTNVIFSTCQTVKIMENSLHIYYHHHHYLMKVTR